MTHSIKTDDTKGATESGHASKRGDGPRIGKLATPVLAEEKPQKSGESVPRKSEASGGQKQKGEVDLFWLETVFQKPEDVFAYKSPSPEALATDAVFALDANVLLAPFQLGLESVANLDTIYRRLADTNRLFAPAQAVREYGKNRARKVADVYAQVYSRLSAIPTVSSLDCPMLEGMAEYDALKESGNAIKEKAKEYKDKLTQLQQALADWGWNDKVSELYRTVFIAARIVQHDLSTEEIRADLTRRNIHKLPPGYKDGDKFDEGIGDLIIWHSLVKLGKDVQKPVIFVCNEEKADWLVRSNEKPLMPRPELTHEFYYATGKHFSMMNWPRFLKTMDAPPNTVREAELARMSDVLALRRDDPLVTQFVGQWRILNKNGRLVFVITLDKSFDAKKSDVPNATGTWEIVGNEARMTWSDGWRDKIQPQGDRFHKIAYAPGTSWNDLPDNTEWAIKETPS